MTLPEVSRCFPASIEELRLLRELRFELLEEIHGRQQDLDRLDYFIHEISTQRKGAERI